MTQNSFRENGTGWISPLVYLSNNWLSLTGVITVTTATVFWLFLLPTTLRGATEHPYVGILGFLILPALFMGGLLMIPAGILLRRRKQRRGGVYPTAFPPLDLRSVELRRLLAFFLVTTVINIIIASQLTYGAVHYMDSPTFCGLTCHGVMQPEYTAYVGSPHARVACVDCHIGPGASWFVRSKLSGVGQVIAVAFGTYPRPIPVPIHNLRPARETCETCHWPEKFIDDRVLVITKFADDEQNSLTKTVLLLKIGGGNGGKGIHGAHVGSGIKIRYRTADKTRQTIPWVEYTDQHGQTTVYQAPTPETPVGQRVSTRTMDCMDCHNRPAHPFETPERAVDHALLAGDIAPTLPFVKKQGLALLNRSYATNMEAATEIPAALARYYEQSYPAISREHHDDVARSGRNLVAIYARNVFPHMNLSWRTYPRNIGHVDFPGCFRCHDGDHTSSDGRTVTQDCSVCHNVLAVDDPEPKILADLGLAQTSAAQQE